jgi:hypothetical protein
MVDMKNMMRRFSPPKKGINRESGNGVAGKNIALQCLYTCDIIEM